MASRWSISGRGIWTPGGRGHGSATPSFLSRRSPKIATATCLLILIDRGLVDLDATVATYWPEFAQGGKGHVTVREAMSHRAGVPGLDQPVAFEAVHDWAYFAARIVLLEPLLVHR